MKLLQIFVITFINIDNIKRLISLIPNNITVVQQELNYWFQVNCATIIYYFNYYCNIFMQFLIRLTSFIILNNKFLILIIISRLRVTLII